MPKPQSMPSRQRPVSCRFCRSRKLRCDREVPCSNCVSRGISCELELAVRSSPRGTGVLEPELVERVRMLEELVGSRKSQPDDAAKPRNDTDVYGEQASRSSLSPQIDHLDNDVAWLGSIYSDQNASDKMPSNRMLFKVCPIQQIMEAPLYINQSTFMPTRFEPSRCVWLPQHSEAKILLDKYIQDIDHHHHIVHTPSLPLIIDDFYTALNQQGQVNPGVVILLLGIFASSTYSWAAPDCERGLFSQPVEANNQWPLWIRSLEDVLDIAHRTTAVSIEGIQGAIISFWVVFNTDGLTRRGRSLWNIAFSLARELKLHRLDHSSNANLANCAQTEIKRRIWWYLVASDWSASSRFAGAYQGVYQFHVRQMIVRKPLNLNDEDLVDGMSLVERPLSQPTTMSYSILRIRLGEISRNFTDRTAFIMAQSSIPYHVIMDIDTELQLLLNDVPRFFSMPVADLIKTYQLDPSRAEAIAYQGYMFSTLFYSQRCIIHFPYYGRGFVDHAYASSRDICLQSACLIIQTEVKFKESRLWNATRFKYLGLFVAVFMASIVLLMHQCYNKGFPRDEAQRKVLADAMGILEEGRHESETTSKFLDSLMQILRKHLMPPTQSASSRPIDPIIGSEHVSTSSEQAINNPATTKTYSNDVPMESLPVTATGALEHAKLPDLNFSGDRQGVEENMSSYFTELALNFEQGIDFSNLDWDNIFSGLDSSFV